MKILVNKCPYTGELFESDSKYKSHLARLAKERKREKIMQEKKDQFFSWLQEEKLKIYTISEIAPWIIKNQLKLIKALNEGVGGYIHMSERNFNNKVFDKLQIVGKYSNSVSNTHSCPKGGVINWGYRDKSLPRGYPGWDSSISGKLIYNKDVKGHQYRYNELFRLIGINIGSGSGNTVDFHYTSEIFLDDWPGLAQELVANKLKGVK